MDKFVIAWRDINNPGRALCVGGAVEEPVAVELVPAAQEEAEDRPYRAVRFDSFEEAFAATNPLAALLAGLEAAVVQESELGPQFAPDRPSPRPMLETGPHPLEETVAELERELGRLTEELLAAQGRQKIERQLADEVIHDLHGKLAAALETIGNLTADPEAAPVPVTEN